MEGDTIILIIVGFLVVILFSLSFVIPSQWESTEVCIAYADHPFVKLTNSTYDCRDGIPTMLDGIIVSKKFGSLYPKLCDKYCVEKIVTKERVTFDEDVKEELKQYQQLRESK